MTQQKMIQICSDDLRVHVVTEKDITLDNLQRIEKQLSAIVNDDVCHDIRGRITSVNMSLFMLEKVIPPDANPRFQMLKIQIEDLSRLVETLTQ